jgi:hypothetical protein
VCGDTGRCSQCPDNTYCSLGKPKSQAKGEPESQAPDQIEPRTAPKARPVVPSPPRQ